MIGSLCQNSNLQLDTTVTNQPFEYESMIWSRTNDSDMVTVFCVKEDPVAKGKRLVDKISSV
eukprot:m.46784 g.46784  ORF g.46784 m.46784 type:complete len:62 (+) comp10406_c0_seq1:1561-1746(+)